MTDWKTVTRALLGTWPTQVSAWGTEAIEAYLGELGARGLSPDDALHAIRTYDPDADFPPSAAKLAAHARVDPSVPTFAELLVLIYGPGGVMRAHPVYKGGWRGSELAEATERVQLDRADRLHPRVGEFVRRFRLDRLRALDVDDSYRRHELEREWSEFLDRSEEREVSALVSGRSGRDGLGRLDPLSGIGVERRRELEAGSDA